PFSNNVMYSCRGLTHLSNGNVEITYPVHYAKGPLTCSVELTNKNQTIWNMCENTQINWTINCQVSQNDVSPGIKAKIRINSDYSNLLDSQNITDFYQVKHEINITYSGSYTVGCEVQNIKFSDYKATCSYTPVLQVIEPPRASPTLAIKNDSKDVLDGVQENKVYIVECRAPGGTPTVSNITVSCGNIKESTQSGYIFTSSVTFTRNMIGKSCTCLAQHITGCYANNNTTKMPNIF
ncbi:vascular cell adhesion protein 1, partial [Biomphalaria glabrata]